MSSDTKPLLKWFGYSRRERRSTFILLVVILLVIAIRYLVPQRNMEIEDITAALTSAGVTSGDFNEDVPDSLKLFLYKHEKTEFESFKRGRIEQQIKTISRLQAHLIDLNTSDSATLETLPGIGPVMSVRIIKYRNLLGGFVSVSQLKEVFGLSEGTYDLIAAKVFADSMAVKKININKAGFKDLIRYPYINRYDVRSILKYRELKGKITGIDEIIENKLITTEKAMKVKPYLKFEE